MEPETNAAKATGLNDRLQTAVGSSHSIMDELTSVVGELRNRLGLNGPPQASDQGAPNGPGYAPSVMGAAVGAEALLDRLNNLRADLRHLIGSV